jgi:hypothetical protein
MQTSEPLCEPLNLLAWGPSSLQGGLFYCLRNRIKIPFNFIGLIQIRFYSVIRYRAISHFSCHICRSVKHAVLPISHEFCVLSYLATAKCEINALRIMPIKMF